MKAIKSSERVSLSGLGAYDYCRSFILEATRLTPKEMANYKKIRAEAEKMFNSKIESKEAEQQALNTSGSRCVKSINEDEILERLTEKEVEILHLLVDGFSYKECAESLCISETTIKTHVNNLFGKKQVHSLQQLLVKEFKNKIQQLQKIQPQEVTEMANQRNEFKLTKMAQHIIDTELTMLSDREKEVAGLMLDGKNKNEIMAILNIAVGTYGVYQYAIFSKTQSLVNYQTYRDKKQEFTNYFLGGSEPVQQQNTNKNEQKEPVCEQKQSENEQPPVEILQPSTKTAEPKTLQELVEYYNSLDKQIADCDNLITFYQSKKEHYESEKASFGSKLFQEVTNA